MGYDLTRRRVLATGAAVAGTAALLGPLATTASASAKPSGGGTRPTIVLVHGGFADASCWNGTIELLQHAGYPTVAPANPLRGLPTDAPYLASVLRSIQGPIVLVGHSYGGAVITNAAAGIPNVAALVYIAAFVPDQGEQLGVLIGTFPGSIIQSATTPVPFPNADGTTGIDLYLRADGFRAAFAADLPEATTRLMQATQRPFSASSFTDVTTAAAWHTIPSWGLVAGADKAIPPALERYFYQRAGAREVVEIAGASHVAMISHPGAVAALVKKAAVAVG
ncbi:alpha/beta fold hydrolase [Actinacidiphila rubida]|uniref:Pimeloyl-ACP methyl ester carboxylesterase n=1 Tax=Actinacidiphila rubida TaxID=310780 RepID=A0A1H8EBG7_9ACTN|nr:alpha/beta hydrolase [Actinacidiphila rubida]SEN16842.1 Pimeloyl-ACP methyl ester carboxylesterase [Actinacidiphila rubida]